MPAALLLITATIATSAVHLVNQPDTAAADIGDVARLLLLLAATSFAFATAGICERFGHQSGGDDN